MKSISGIIIAVLLVALYSCSGNSENGIQTTDKQVDSLSSMAEEAEQKTYQNPENSETVNGYYGEDGKPLMLTFESYPDFVQYFYNNGLICVIHKVIGEEGAQGSETKYYFSSGKLIHYLVNNETKEVTPDIEKATVELLDIEAESQKILNIKGKIVGQNANVTDRLDFLNEFIDKPSYDISEDDRIMLRLKEIVKGEGDFESLKSQLAYGDAIQKFGSVVVINGQARVAVDEEGNQLTFVSIIVADLANNVLSVGMTDEKGNTSVFYTEAPGTKYPKQLVDWFTEDYRTSFKMEVQ